MSLTLASRFCASLASLLLLAGAASAGAPPPQTMVDAAVSIVTRIKSDHRYAKELRVSKGLLLFPVAPRTAGGPISAILLKHDSDGLWSPPAFLTVGPLSSTRPTNDGTGGALLLMTGKAVDEFSRPHFTYSNNDGLAVVTFDWERGQPLGEGDIELWSKALAGVSLDGVTFAADPALNEAYYGRDADISAILSGAVQDKGATALRKALPL